MRKTPIWRHGLYLLSLLLSLSCRTTGSVSREQATEGAACQAPVLLQPLLKPSIQCADPAYYASPLEAEKRKLQPWLPCNDVERIDGAVDLFGPSPADTPENIRQSTFARVYYDWLIPVDRFSPASAAAAIEKRNEHLPSHPIAETAMARKIHEMIEGAQHNIIMDIFLFGGSMGAAITRDLARAADRGVEVVLLHDNVSKFIVANEMDPLWAEILKFSRSHPQFVALESNIHTPQRVSSIPAGLERISSLFGSVIDLSVSLDGKSDHSKILMVDTLFTESLDEYKTLKPMVMVSSHNLVDSAASFYHDEAVVITGPGAVSSLLSYRSDIYWALKQARDKGQSIVEEDAALLESVLSRIDRVAIGPTAIAPRGLVSVQALEVSANDEVRNLDSSIIPRLMAARDTIDLYGKIAYNWPLAVALKDALGRGVKIRMILDQQNPGSALMNAALPYMIMEAPAAVNGKPSSGGPVSGRAIPITKESQLPLKWFLPFRPTQIFKGQDRSALSQEIHAKTIIVDGRWSLFGSANLDTFGWAGGFREYSVWVDDAAIAKQATQLFDRLWNHKYLTVSHAVWVGDEKPDAAVMAYFEGLAKNTPCLPGASCDAMAILQGGRAYRQKGPFRELVRQISMQEAKRIRQVFPVNVPLAATGQPACL